MTGFVLQNGRTPGGVEILDTDSTTVIRPQSLRAITAAIQITAGFGATAGGLGLLARHVV